MDGKKIIEIFQQYIDNPNIINDDNYFKSLIEVITLIVQYDDNDNLIEISNLEELAVFLESDNVLEEICQNNKLINYSFTNPIIMEFVREYVSISKFLEVSKDKVLDYVKNNDIGSWKSNQELFEYVLEGDKNLIYKFNLEYFLPEITDEILENYGEQILKYLKRDPYLSLYPYNKKLFEYVLQNDKSLIVKFELSLFLEITDDTLLEYGEEIVEYIKNNDSFSFIWSNNKKLFEYIAKIDKNLLTKFDLRKIFPEITDKILSEYGQIILNYLEEKEYFGEWEKSKVLFKFLAKKNKDLLSNFSLNIEELFPDLTEDIFKEYGESIIIYLENNKFPYEWDENKELFKYISKNNIKLILNFNLERIFSEITDDILLEYGKEILLYIKEKRCSYPLSENKKLFKYVSQNDKTLISKFDLEKLFYPEITNEILLEYGKEIIDYIKNKYSLGYFWRIDQKLFEYILKNDKSLIFKFNLEQLFPQITEEILSEYGQFILQYIDKKDNQCIWNNECLFKYLLENNISLIKKMTIDFYFLKDEYITILANKFEINKDILKYKLEYLYRKNDEIFKTLDFRILKLDKINMDVLRKFTLYPDIQEKIINLDSYLLDVFSKILNVLNSSKYDLTNVVVKVLNNIGNYKELLMNIKVEQLDEEKIKNLIFMLERDENIFQIKNIEDLNDINFRNKKKDYFSNIASNFNNIDLKDLKKAIFEKKFAIDYEMANFIYERYYHNLEELRKSGLNEKIINLIQVIGSILNEDSFDNLKIIYQQSTEIETDFYASLSLESSIRNEYAKMFLDTLYKVSDKDKSSNTNLQNVAYNGNLIRFYEVDGDFNMQVHGLGSYREWERPLNFKDDWNRPKISYHGICTSYIGNNQIATARPKGPILGFSSYEESALMLSGNYDLFSDDAISDYSTAYHTPYSFLPPKTMIDSTRHNHNEMVIERINNDTIISYKRMPDYIVYIVDDINNQNNFSLENEYYQMTLQCAADMDLPIVIVDRLKYAKREMAKCQELEKKFYQTRDSNTLEDLFLTYMNNGVGCRFFDGQVMSEYHDIFSEQVIQNFYIRLLDHVMNDCNNLESNSITEENILKIGDEILTFIKLVHHEKDSYAVSHKAHMLKPPTNLEEVLEILKNLYGSYKEKIKEMSIISEIVKTENDLDGLKIR